MPAEMFSCEECGKVFTPLSYLHRHQRSSHKSDSFLCHTCGKYFNRRDNHLCYTRNHHEFSDTKPCSSEKMGN